MRKKAGSLIPCFLCLWAGGGGKWGTGEQPSQKRKRALALNTTTDKNTTSQPPRLFPFAPFGEVSDPLAPCPDPLPPTSLLFRLHPLASACIGFSPFASPCIRLQTPNLPFWVGGSGGRVGVSGRGCRVGVSGRLSPAPPAPCPHAPSDTAPLPPLPPLPGGRGGVKFAPTSLSRGGRFSVIRPPQSVRSN